MLHLLIFVKLQVHTQHYKYKATKNRDEELKAMMEAAASVAADQITATTGTAPASTTATSTSTVVATSTDSMDEEAEKLSDEATEYRNWCKLMELNAMKNISANSTSTSPTEERKKSSGGASSS